ncbi:hypothetical protein ACGFIF_05990 [Kribbella sp. NPDC049174]
MSEWFALRPAAGTEAPVRKEADKPRPPVDSDADVPPPEEAPTDE